MSNPILSLLSPSSRATSTRALAYTPGNPNPRLQTRLVSSSPYGRTHVWKPKKLLTNPTVPVFPQRLVRVDGSTIVHHTTSPRSVVRLTRDTTNSPLWNTARFVGMDEDEDEVTGRMGRFSRRFGEMELGGGAHKSGMDLDWISGAATGQKSKSKSK